MYSPEKKYTIVSIHKTNHKTDVQFCALHTLFLDMSMASRYHFFCGRDDFRFLNLAECVRVSRRDREKGEMFILALSSLMFNFSEAV